MIFDYLQNVNDVMSIMQQVDYVCLSSATFCLFVPEICDDFVCWHVFSTFMSDY